MSGDEVAVLLASATLSVALWLGWFAHPLSITRMGSPTPARPLLVGAPIAAAAILLLVLLTAASHDVRTAPQYILMYLALGFAWVGVSVQLLPYFGISARDDAVERRNRAAAWAAAGAVIGIMLCFAGGNIGDGPGWWVVVFSAGLSTAALFVMLAILDGVSGVTEHVTVERDIAAGIRLAGFLVAAGLILGRGVAGDWVSAAATIRDFAVSSWPAAMLLVGAALVERLARPTPARPHPPEVAFGVIPAIVYLAVGLLHIVRLGIPQ
jgi:hypothetical protein